MALRDASVPVWAPRRMVREAQDIPASWDVTSDSLAAWLAGVLGARRLLLIKRADSADGRITATELAQSGLVDKAFPDFLAVSGVPGFLLAPSDQTALAQAVRPDNATRRPVRPVDALA